MMDYNYKSPFEKLINDETETLKRIYDVVAEANENAIMATVKSAGIAVDKFELVRALQYDRNQYDKGFRDAQPKWIPVSERLPEIGVDVIVYIPGAGCQVMWLNRPDQETADITWVMEHGWWCAVDEVTHWMQLPPPPEGGQDD